MRISNVIVFCAIASTLIWVRAINAAPNIEIVNTLDDYKIFLAEFEKAQGDEQKQLAAWDVFEKKYECIFNKKVFDLDKDNSRLEDLKKYFKKLPDIKDKVFELFPKANEVVLSSIVSFAKIFKDFNDSDTVVKVYLMPLSRKTNGYTTTMDGVPLILLGMDGTIMVGQNEKDVEYVSAHELYHVYWWDVKHVGENVDSFENALWQEGFATYASGLVTGFTDEVVLSDPWLGERCKDPSYVKELAKKYKKLITKIYPRVLKKNDEEKGHKLYKQWFGSNDKATKDNPDRPGYCLGLQVVKKLAESNNVDDMVAWKGDELTKKVRETLDDL